MPFRVTRTARRARRWRWGSCSRFLDHYPESLEEMALCDRLEASLATAPISAAALSTPYRGAVGACKRES